MGIDRANRDAARSRVPQAFRRSDELPEGKVFDVVLTDLGQVIYAQPFIEFSRNVVAVICMERMIQLCGKCLESMRRAAPDSAALPTVFGLVDTRALVTRAKDPCHLLRSRAGKEPPDNIDELVANYEVGETVSCDWSTFLAYGKARGAVLHCLDQDIRDLKHKLTGIGTLVMDGIEDYDLSGKGEAEIKAQYLILTTAGHGFLIDSNDTDFLPMWYLMAPMLRDEETGRFTKDVILRSRVGGGTRNYTFAELQCGLMVNTGATKEEACKTLEEEADIPRGTRSKDMPLECPTRATCETEMCDLNMLYEGLAAQHPGLPCSMAFVAFLTGSDLVKGRWAEPTSKDAIDAAVAEETKKKKWKDDKKSKKKSTLPHANALAGIGAAVFLSYYLLNRQLFGDLVKTEKDGPCNTKLRFNMKGIWGLISAVYSAKNFNKLKKAKMSTYGIVQPYDVVRRVIVTPDPKTKKIPAYNRRMPSVKAMAVSIAATRFACCYYGLNDQGDCLATNAQTGLCIHGFKQTAGAVNVLPDWDPDVDKTDDDRDDLPLHDFEQFSAYAREPLHIIGGLPLIPKKPRLPGGPKKRKRGPGGAEDDEDEEEEEEYAGVEQAIEAPAPRERQYRRAGGQIDYDAQMEEMIRDHEEDETAATPPLADLPPAIAARAVAVASPCVKGDQAVHQDGLDGESPAKVRRTSEPYAPADPNQDPYGWHQKKKNAKKS